MKIESIKIENFGKLSNLSLDFKDGYNLLKEDNGWGKSTLASFIRAMFYGFEGEGKHGAIENERKRFSPWQGGVYGGSLVFETKGKHYLITRTFGSKIKDDLFELRDADTNLISDKFSSSIGEELFHINSESFMRTVFIKQNDCASSQTTGDINSRIGNISDSIDINKYEAADKLLLDAINHLSTKKNGKRGELSQKISETKGNLNSLVSVDTSISEVEERIKGYEESLFSIKNENVILEEKRNKVTKYGRLLTQKEYYEGLKKEATDRALELDSVKKKFPGKAVDINKVNEWNKSVEEINNYDLIYSSNKLTDSETIQYESLCKAFNEGLPTGSDIDFYMSESKKLENLKADANRTALSEEDKGNLSFYKTLFGISADPVADLGAISNKWNNRIRLGAKAELSKKEYEEAKVELDSKKNVLNYGSKKIYFCSLPVILTGILLLLISNNFIMNFDTAMIVRYISYVFLIGGACISFSALLFRKPMYDTTAEEAELGEKESSLKKLMSEIETLESEVYTYITGHGMVYDENTVDQNLRKLTDSAYEYKNLLAKKSLSDSNNHLEEIEDKEKNISSFLKYYLLESDPEDFAVSLSKLSHMVENFRSLDKKSKEAGNAIVSYKRIKDNLESQLKDYEYEPSMDLANQIEEIAKLADSYEALKKLADDSQKRLEGFEAQNDMTEILQELPIEGILSLEDIAEKQNELDEKEETVYSNLRIDRRNLEALQEAYENRLELQAELDELEESLKDASEKSDLYELTRKCLTSAKESMTARYIGPLYEGFSYYYKYMTDEYADDYKLDANLELTRVEAGAQRSKESFSYGYQDLLGLCMRLAMADAMYKGEKPVLILDDPFVNLDDGKMQGAKKLLLAVAEKYQIIYLTCRENRL